MSAPVTMPPAHPSRTGVKLPAGVVTVLVLLIAAAGGWFVWSQLFASHKVDESQYESNDSPAAMARSRFFDQPTTNPTAEVTLRKDGTGEVRISGATGRFTKDKGVMNAAFIYQDLRFVSPEDRQANMARMMALGGPMFRRGNERSHVAVSEDQLKKLRELTPPFNVPLSDATRKNLLDLWAQYGKAAEADKLGISQKLESQLRDLAISGIDPTSRAYNDYAAKIRAILTPEQMADLRADRQRGPGGPGGGGPNRQRQGQGPATRP